MSHFVKFITGWFLLAWIAVFSSAFVSLGPSVGNQALTVWRTTDAIQNNNATPVDDSELFFPISGIAGDRYEFVAYIDYQATTVADFLYGFATPAGATGSMYTVKNLTTATGCSGTANIEGYPIPTASNFGVGGVGLGTSCMAITRGMVLSGGTAGNVVVRWSQRVLEVSDTTLKAGSYITYRKLP